DSSAPALSGVLGDRVGPVGGAAREQACDLGGHACLEFHVAGRTLLGVARAAPRPSILVRQTPGFGLAQRLLLYQHALALVAAAGATETHHNGRQAARRPRTASQRSVAAREEDEVVHVRTDHADRPAVVHDQQLAIVPAALRTGPRLECRDHDELAPARWLLC